MKLKKIDLREHLSEVEYIIELYQHSFPEIERRSIDKMLHILENEDNFNIFLLTKDDNYVGFITYWEFDDFVYVEHFAIDTATRGNGYGSETLKNFVTLTHKPIILEVEEPEDEMSVKRISFYKKCGFDYWQDVEYLQPPYQEGFPHLPLKLMTYRNLDLKDMGILDRIKTEIHTKVYQFFE